MTEELHSDPGRLLDPIDRFSEVLFGLFILFPARGVIDYCAQQTEAVTTGAWWTTWPGGSVRPDARVSRVETLTRERPADWLWSYRRWKVRRELQSAPGAAANDASA